MGFSIVSSVGEASVNRKSDVTTVQKLLNMVRQTWGGPKWKLAEDGNAGPLTKQAIRDFQLFHFRQQFLPDGRVDPGLGTWNRLLAAAQSTEVPKAAFQFDVQRVPLIKQPSPKDFTCWAAVAAMLMSARDTNTYSIEQAMDKAGKNWRQNFDRRLGLDPLKTREFLSDCKLRARQNACLEVGHWLGLLRQHGPLGVVGLFGLLPHTIVVTGMYGDGTSYGTFLKVNNPWGASYNDHYASFYTSVLDYADNPYRVDVPQIWHK